MYVTDFLNYRSSRPTCEVGEMDLNALFFSLPPGDWSSFCFNRVFYESELLKKEWTKKKKQKN